MKTYMLRFEIEPANDFKPFNPYEDDGASVRAEQTELMRLAIADDRFVLTEVSPQRQAVELAAQSMHDALKFVKKFFTDLEDGCDDDDPLKALRRQYHAPVHAVVDKALNLAHGKSL